MTLLTGSTRFVSKDGTVILGQPTGKNKTSFHAYMFFLPISFNGSTTSHFGSDRKNIETCCKAISGKKKCF